MESIEHWVRHASALHQQHRRALHGSLIALLAGFSAVAFGIAPLVPDAADLPRSTVIEQIDVDDRHEQEHQTRCSWW